MSTAGGAMLVVDAPAPAQRWKFYAVRTIVIGALSSLLIIGSYTRVSQTFDEPTHIATGMEALQLHRYTMQTENPPLSRMPFALIPYLSGLRIDAEEANTFASGDRLLYETGNYTSNLTRARLPNLLVFWLTLLMTWVLSGGRSNPKVAALATSLVATLPPIVAHSGFATTDMPFVLAFLFALWRWKAVLAEPSRRNAAWLGLSIGVALSAKFSTIPFLPPVALALLLAYWWSGQLAEHWHSPALLVRRAALTLVVAAITIWASYSFRIGTIAELPKTFGPYGSMPTTGWVAAIQDVPLPAHEFWHGLLFLQGHAKAGHLSYMLGETSQRGFWLYYPLRLLIKTPLGTLALFVIGCTFAMREKTAPAFMGYALGALGLLVAAATSPINLGLRHVFAVYPLLCMAAAAGVVTATEKSVAHATLARIVTVAVLLLQVTSLVISFPQQLSYYNLIASGRPDYFIGDADFDWGQDVFAMEAYFREHPVPELYLVPNGTALFCRHELPPLKPLPVDHQVNGWIAIFQRLYQANGAGGTTSMRKDLCQPPGGTNVTPTAKGWLNWLHQRKPEVVIGSGVLLFHVTDAHEG